MSSVEISVPDYSPELKSGESWGFITSHFREGFDYHSSYWFNSQRELILFLCLKTNDYLGHSEAPVKVEELLLSTIEAGVQGKHNLEKALYTLWSLFDSSTKVVWWGQAEELMTGQESFALKLRQQYFEDRGLVDPPSLVTGWEVDHFREWLAEFDGFIRP